MKKFGKRKLSLNRETVKELTLRTEVRGGAGATQDPGLMHSKVRAGCPTDTGDVVGPVQTTQA